MGQLLTRTRSIPLPKLLRLLEGLLLCCVLCKPSDMDGLSFAEFESSSMDSLYNRGFANKKNLDEAAKNFKPEDFARQLQNGKIYSRLCCAHVDT